MEIADFLQKCGVPELLNTFEENGIDKTVLPMLTEDVIKELIPKIGKRLKFMQGWRAEFQKDKVSSPVEVPCEDFDVRDSLQDNSCWSVEALDRSSEGSPNFDQSTSSDSFTPPPLKREKRVHFVAKDILSQTSGGRKVVSNIQKQMFCSKKDRHILVDLLTNYLIQQHGDKPSSFIKSALSESIVTSFPCLKDPDSPLGYEAWYCKGAKGRPATGYIEEHLRYIRKKAIAVGKQNKGNPYKEECEVTSVDEEESYGGAAGAAAAMVDWLKCNKEPQDKVQSYMEQTAMYRSNIIAASTFSVGEIFEEYPHLLSEGQIAKDFATLYPALKEKLFEKWTTFAPFVIDYADQQSQWRELLEINVGTDMLTKNEAENLAFSMLPFVLKGNKLKKQPSLIEAVNSFIDVQPEVTDITFYSQSLSEKATPQPFIVCRGSRVNPTQCFVIIERHAFPFSTLIEAVDTCFKSFYVLNIQYQPRCYAVWQFFQSVIFGFPYTTIPNSVRDIRAFLASKTSKQ